MTKSVIIRTHVVAFLILIFTPFYWMGLDDKRRSEADIAGLMILPLLLDFALMFWLLKKDAIIWSVSKFLWYLNYAILILYGLFVLFY